MPRTSRSDGGIMSASACHSAKLLVAGGKMITVEYIIGANGELEIVSIDGMYISDIEEEIEASHKEGK